MLSLCRKAPPKSLSDEADYLEAKRQQAIADLGPQHVLHPDYNPAANPHHHLRCIRPKKINVVMGRRV